MLLEPPDRSYRTSTTTMAPLPFSPNMKWWGQLLIQDTYVSFPAMLFQRCFVLTANVDWQTH